MKQYYWTPMVFIVNCTRFGHLILSKIIQIVATTGHK